MRERGLCVDHTTIYRWVQRYAPEIDKRCRPFLRCTTDSYRIDETYVRVGGAWHYRDRGVDSNGDTLDVLLRATRDRNAAIAFFRKTVGAGSVATFGIARERRTSHLFRIVPEYLGSNF